MQMEWTKSDFCGKEEVGSNCGLTLEGTNHNLKRLEDTLEHLMYQRAEINQGIKALSIQIDELMEDWREFMLYEEGGML